MNAIVITNPPASLPGFIGIIAMLAAIQGVILFALLFQRRKNKSNLYLSFFLLSFSAYILIYSDPSFEVFLRYPYLLILVDFIPLIIPPLMYFYFFYTLHRNVSPRYPFFIHAAPAALNFTVVHFVYFYLGFEKISEIAKQVILHSPPYLVSLSNWTKYISGVVYSVLILKLIYQYAKKSPGWTNNRKQRYWLIALTSTFIFCWCAVIATGVVIINNNMNQAIVKGFVVFQTLTLTASMYVIAYFTFRYSSLFPEEQARNKIAGKLNISLDKLNHLQEKLQKLMFEDRYYLDETLTLQMVAKKLQIHPNALSYFINEIYGKNLNEYLNDLRLNYFIKLLNNDTESTILRLAFESGFSSKTTFNRAFKKKFNVSPVEYRKTLLQ